MTRQCHLQGIWLLLFPLLQSTHSHLSQCWQLQAQLQAQLEGLPQTLQRHLRVSKLLFGTLPQTLQWHFRFSKLSQTLQRHLRFSKLLISTLPQTLQLHLRFSKLTTQGLQA